MVIATDALPSGSERSGISRLENEGGPPPVRPTPDGDVNLSLAHFGIVAIPSTMYEWGGYRYTNASDAIAAAKRGALK